MQTFEKLFAEAVENEENLDEIFGFGSDKTEETKKELGKLLRKGTKLSAKLVRKYAVELGIKMSGKSPVEVLAKLYKAAGVPERMAINHSKSYDNWY